MLKHHPTVKKAQHGKGCKYCGKPIYWSKTEDGKFVPMELDSKERHFCKKLTPQREPQTRKCDKCGGEIYFDDMHTSPSGKKIPLDYETDQPHQCTGLDRERDRAWEEDQNYWRKKRN